MQSYNNGRRCGEFYRQEFAKAGVLFNPRNMRGRSTDYHRTRQTGESFLRGLFSDGMERDTSGWDLPLMSFVDAESDSLPMAYKTCPGWSKEVSRVCVTYSICQY